MNLFQVRDVVFNLEHVSRVIRHEDGRLILYFSDGYEPIEFKGDAAEVVWRAIERMAYIIPVVGDKNASGR